MPLPETKNSPAIPKEKLFRLTQNVLDFLEETPEEPTFTTRKFLQMGTNRLIFLESVLGGADMYEKVSIYSFLIASSPYPNQAFDLIPEVSIDVIHAQTEDEHHEVRGELTPGWVEMIEKVLSEYSRLPSFRPH